MVAPGGNHVYAVVFSKKKEAHGSPLSQRPGRRYRRRGRRSLRLCNAQAEKWGLHDIGKPSARHGTYSFLFLGRRRQRLGVLSNPKGGYTWIFEQGNLEGRGHFERGFRHKRPDAKEAHGMRGRTTRRRGPRESARGGRAPRAAARARGGARQGPGFGDQSHRYETARRLGRRNGDAVSEGGSASGRRGRDRQVGAAYPRRAWASAYGSTRRSAAALSDLRRIRFDSRRARRSLPEAASFESGACLESPE